MVRVHVQNTTEEYVRFYMYNYLKRRLWLFVACAAFCIVMGVSALLAKNTMGIAIIAVGIAVPVLLSLMQKSGVRARVSGDFMYLKTTYDYEFLPQMMRVKSKCGSKEMSAEFEYSKIFGAYETKNNFYIYLRKDKKNPALDRALLMNKKDVVEGSVEALRGIFITAKKLK